MKKVDGKSSLAKGQDNQWILHDGGKSMLGPLYEIDPYALLNQKIQIYWEGEKEYFAGTVTQFNVDDWHHMVEYDDGDKAWELLVLQNVKIPKRPMSRPDCRADWPVPSSALMSSLGAILTEKAEKMEDGARSTTHGTSRSRDVKGSKTAKQLRELILKIMAKADRYEAMEQRQGALAPATRSTTGAASTNTVLATESAPAGPSATQHEPDVILPSVETSTLPKGMLPEQVQVSKEVAKKKKAVHGDPLRVTAKKLQLEVKMPKLALSHGSENERGSRRRKADTTVGKKDVSKEKGKSMLLGTSAAVLEAQELDAGMKSSTGGAGDAPSKLAAPIQAEMKGMGSGTAAASSRGQSLTGRGIRVGRGKDRGGRGQKSGDELSAPLQDTVKQTMSAACGDNAVPASVGVEEAAIFKHIETERGGPSGSSAVVAPQLEGAVVEGQLPVAGEVQNSALGAGVLQMEGVKKKRGRPPKINREAAAISGSAAPTDLPVASTAPEAKKADSLLVPPQANGRAVVWPSLAPASCNDTDVQIMLPSEVVSAPSGAGDENELQGTAKAATAAAVEPAASPRQGAAPAASPPVPQGRVSQLIIAAKAAELLASCTPEEEGLRTALTDAGLPGGCRCYPVHCNGLPGLLLLPMNCELSIRVFCCCDRCQRGSSAEARNLRPIQFEEHAGLGSSKKPKTTVRLLPVIRKAGSPKVIMCMGDWMSSINWPSSQPLDPDVVHPALTGPQADAAEAAQAAALTAAAAGQTQKRPPRPKKEGGGRSSLGHSLLGSESDGEGMPCRLKKGYALLPDGEGGEGGEGDEEGTGRRRRKQTVRYAPSSEDDEEGGGRGRKRGYRRRGGGEESDDEAGSYPVLTGRKAAPGEEGLMSLIQAEVAAAAAAWFEEQQALQQQQPSDVSVAGGDSQAVAVLGGAKPVLTAILPPAPASSGIVLSMEPAVQGQSAAVALPTTTCSPTQNTITAKGSLPQLVTGAEEDSAQHLEDHNKNRLLGPKTVNALELTRFFKDKPDVLSWMSDTPDAETLSKFKAWTSRLGSVISDTPLPNMPPGAQLVTIAEAVQILKTLGAHPVNLKLLELTQVSKTVAMLRSHRDLRVAQEAANVVVAWRVNATATLDRTQLIMSALPRASGLMKKRKSRIQEDV